MNEPIGQYITPRALAARLGLASPRLIWKALARGELSHVRLGRSIRIAEDEARRWLAARSRPARDGDQS